LYLLLRSVAVINQGADAGKLVAVVDVLDANRALVDGPAHGIARQVMSFKRLNLTDLTVPIFRGARTKTVAKSFQEADTVAKWNKSHWAQRLAAQKTRASLSDFDRFKAMLAKKKVRALSKKDLF
jgi:large subunit ribosomal protein L14e